MAKYRKKPVVVEAVQWFKFGDSDAVVSEPYKTFNPQTKEYDSVQYIDTLEGRMYVKVGDYVIKGINGEFYPCKPDIFEKTYEKVD